jgi:hypothetical protein
LRILLIKRHSKQHQDRFPRDEYPIRTGDL